MTTLREKTKQVHIRIDPSRKKTVLDLRRGTLGGSEHRDTAKKFGKYCNTAKKLLNTATPQYRVETRCKNAL